MIKFFTPLSDMVLIERLEAETTTPGGIHLPNRVVEKSNRGKVISVGKGKVLDDGLIRKMEVKKGDLVLFSPSKVAEIKIDGKPYLIMSESSIIAVVEKVD